MNNFDFLATLEPDNHSEIGKFFLRIFETQFDWNGVLVRSRSNTDTFVWMFQSIVRAIEKISQYVIEKRSDIKKSTAKDRLAYKEEGIALFTVCYESGKRWKPDLNCDVRKLACDLIALSFDDGRKHATTQREDFTLLVKVHLKTGKAFIGSSSFVHV